MKQIKNILVFTIMMLVVHKLYSQTINDNSDPLITSAINAVDSNEIRQLVQEMQNLETRFMIAPNRKDVALWIKDKFEAFNIPEVYLDSFQSHVDIHYLNLDYDTITWQYNVIARIPGTELPDEVIIAGAHYDNVSYDSDPEIYAPGADDNASGVTALFETARVINEINYQPKRTIEFVAFAAEEMMYTGYSGAEYHAEQCDSLHRNIICMINNDMIAYNESDWEISISMFTGFSFATNLISSVVNEYTELDIELWDESSAYGDCEPFWNIGIPSVYIMEHEFNPAYHTSADTIGSLNFPYCTEMIKVTIGSVIKASNELNILNTKIIYSNLNDIIFYPNPVSDQVHIESINKIEIQSIKIFNLKGDLVFTSNALNTNMKIINIQYLKSGYYLMEVQTEAFKTMYSFLKI